MQVVILGVFLQSAGGDFGCFSPDLMIIVILINNAGGNRSCFSPDC